MFCSACGRSNSDDASFCGGCGSKLTTSDARQSVVLIDKGPRPISVIKLVRELTGLTLHKATNLVNAGNAVIKSDLTQDEAETAAARLRDTGAAVLTTTDPEARRRFSAPPPPPPTMVLDSVYGLRPCRHNWHSD
jgi:large subunit ribosomal protein L7/L12